MNGLSANPKKIIKGLALLAALAVAGTGVWHGYRHFAGEEEPAQAAVRPTAVVTRGDLTVTVSGTGSVEPVNAKTVLAGAAGTIAEVRVAVGDSVEEGDVLAVFESDDRADQIRLKELELERSRLDLEQLFDQYKTAGEEARGAIRLNIEKQQLSIRAAEEELQELKESARPVQVTAPISGKITELHVAPGDTVNANAEVARIVDYSRLAITVPIDELDIVNVEVGQPATVLVDAFPDETFTGTVTAIADQGSYTNGVATFDVTIEIEDPGSIKAGMSAEASIRVASRENVLLVPVDAVQSAGGRHFVLLAETGGPAAGGGTTGGTGGGTGSGAAKEGAGTGPPAPAGRGNGPAGEQTGTGAAAVGRSGSGTGPAAGDGGMNPDRPNAGGWAGNRGNAPLSGGAAGQGAGAGNRADRGKMAGAADAGGVRRVFVEIGISNEDYAEVVSGLQEGDVVILPTTAAASSGSNAFPGGFPGRGGFPGGMMPGGGFPGGGGFTGGRGASGGGPGGMR